MLLTRVSEAAERGNVAGALVAASSHGVAAFVAGLALTYAFVLRVPDAPTTVDATAVVYGLFHVVVRDDAGTWFLTGARPTVVFVLAFPAVPLLVAGIAHARTDGTESLPAADAARRGAAVAGSYAVLLGLSAVLFEARLGGGGLPPTTGVRVALDPVTTGLAGLLVGAAFGGAGGVLVHRRSDLARTVVLLVPSLLVLVFVLGA